MNRRSGVLRSLFAFAFIALSAVFFVNTVFATWLLPPDEVNDNANEASDSFTNSTAEPICYNGSTNVVYSTIAKALDTASSGQYIYMFTGKTFTSDVNLTIKTGVHLVLPFVGKDSISSTTSPLYDLSSPNNINNYGEGKQGDTSANVGTYRKCLLNMRSGADIIVNSGGYLHLGGVFGTTGNLGYYSEINLGSGSMIDCSGTFDCFGYVKESSTDAYNPIKNSSSSFDNSNDSGRSVVINSGGTMNSFMAMYDALSGGGLGTVIQSSKVCPFWSYDFPAAQTYVKFMHGCTFNISAVLTIGTTTARGTGMIIAPSSNSSKALFKTTSGFMSFEYSPSSASIVNYTSKTVTKTNMVVNGNISFESLSISVSGYSIDTSKFFLPISYKQIIRLVSGSVLNVNSYVKFLNESELHINNGATLNINHQAIFYTKQAVTLSGATKYTHNSKDSLLDNNGTIVLNNNENGKGKIGGFIQHSNTSNGSNSERGCIDLSKATSGSLSVTAIEDGEDREVTVNSNALFVLNDSDHTQGTMVGEMSLSQTYYSGYDSSFAEGEKYYWIGSFVSTVKVNVTVLSSTYRFPFKYYTLKSNTSASATGAEVLADNATTTQSYTIQGGLYINFNAPNVANVDITVNGVSQTYNGSSWFRVTSGADIVLTPAQGFKVTLYATGVQNKYYNGSAMIEDTSVDLGCTNNTDSGRGSTTVEIWTSTSKSSGFAKAASGTGDATIILASNQYYRLYCSQLGTNSNLKKIKFTGKYYDYNAVTKTGTVKSGFDLNSTSNRDSNTFTASDCEWRTFTFGFKEGASCILPTTLVTMADGSRKQVKNISQGDLVKVFNHETGKIDIAPITFNDYEPEAFVNVINLNFSNGSYVGVVSEHGFFDLDTMRYEYIDEYNYQEFVGHRFYGENGDTITLVNAYVDTQYTEVYSPTSFYHLDYFVEGILSMPGGITGLFNIFEYGDNLQYEPEAYARDIETYGLFTYEDLAPLGVTEIMFEAYAGKYLKVALGKGILTEEYLAYLIDRYGGFTD